MSANMFIKFTDKAGAANKIPGGCTIEVGDGAMKGKQWIEVESWSISSHQSVGSKRSSSGAATTERVDVGDFNFSKAFDSASPILHQFCWKGEQVPQVVLCCYRASGGKIDGDVPYLKVTMTDVLINAISTSGSAGGVPYESLTLDWGTILMEYTPQEKEGDVGGKPGSTKPKAGYSRITHMIT